MEELEVVDPDPNATDRLHRVSISAAKAFCELRPDRKLRADYFRKMLRGGSDEHQGWMRRDIVAGRWIRHRATGEYVAIIGKITSFIKNVCQKRPSNDMPFHPNGNELAKLLARVDAAAPSAASSKAKGE